jgi:hypothetical protein
VIGRAMARIAQAVWVVHYILAVVLSYGVLGLDMGLIIGAAAALPLAALLHFTYLLGQRIDHDRREQQRRDLHGVDGQG